MTPLAICSYRRESWQRRLTVEQLIILRDRFPDLPQAPLATAAHLKAEFGSPVRIVWECFADKALLDALGEIDQPSELKNDFDQAGE